MMTILQLRSLIFVVLCTLSSAVVVSSANDGSIVAPTGTDRKLRLKRPSTNIFEEQGTTGTEGVVTTPLSEEVSVPLAVAKDNGNDLQGQPYDVKISVDRSDGSISSATQDATDEDMETAYVYVEAGTGEESNDPQPLSVPSSPGNNKGPPANPVGPTAYDDKPIKAFGEKEGTVTTVKGSKSGSGNLIGSSTTLVGGCLAVLISLL